MGAVPRLSAALDGEKVDELERIGSMITCFYPKQTEYKCFLSMLRTANQYLHIYSFSHIF